MIPPPPPPLAQVRTPAMERFLSVADRIGCALVRDAIWSGDRCSWMTWTKNAIKGAYRPVHLAASLDVYLGTSGIALFLTHLAEFTGDAQQRATAAAALRQVEQQLATCSPTSFGLYSGSAGAAWVMAMLGELTGSDRWSELGVRSMRQIAETAVLDGQFDLLAGQAGLIMGLIDVARRCDAPDLLDHARRIADVLINSGRRIGDQICWAAGDGESQPLLGLSHGTTGVALALLELNHVSPDARYVEAATSALRYERACFSREQQNWPDFRLFPGVTSALPSFPVAWCHGSTGMGVARLRMLDLLPLDEALLPEIDLALSNATRALNMPLSPFTTDATLCHGVTGNNDLLLLIAERLDRADALAAAQHVGDVLMGLWHTPRMPWMCGIPDCGESPSLLTGNAGIGLHYLRLYDWKRVPSMLLPAFPRPELPAPAGALFAVH